MPTAPVGVGGLGKRLSAPLPAPPLSSASSVAPVPPLPMAGGGGGTGEKGNGNSSSNGKGAAEKAVTALSWEEQDELAKNVNEIFRVSGWYVSVLGGIRVDSLLLCMVCDAYGGMSVYVVIEDSR